MGKMENYVLSEQPGSEEVVFVALGGLGIIGMNFYLYGHKGKWLIVDFGIGFAGDTIPGADILVADPTFIEQRREDIVGLVLTHAHEDHLGALAYMYDRIKCPIYATPFTARVAACKMQDAGYYAEEIINTVASNAHFALGPFSLQFIHLTHSTLEAQGLCIRTDVGTLFHTGDWKFDENPMVGETSEIQSLEALAKENVIALIGDSTNVLSKGHTKSEGDVRDGLKQVISALTGKVAVTCFASNITRVESIALAAQENNRKIALCGRSLWRMVKCAKDTGYLKNSPEFFEAKDLAGLPSDQVLYICTGSQGESRAALARIARKDYHHVRLAKGDTVIFSARAIPTNQKKIADIQSMLLSSKIHIITATDAPVHASGHGAQEEMKKMYDLVKPRFSIPMHGESLHLVRHAQLAEEAGVEAAHVLHTGTLVSIAKDSIKQVDEVYTSTFVVDGDNLIEAEGTCVQQRRKIAWGGLVVISVVINKAGKLLSLPNITMEGVYVSKKQDDNTLGTFIEDTLHSMSKKTRADDNGVVEQIRVSVRRHLFSLTGKKVPVKVHVARI